MTTTSRSVLGGRIVTVSGVRCMIFAPDSTIRGGTITPIRTKKSLPEAIPLENKVPVVRLVVGGWGFANQMRLSAAGIAQLSVMQGHSTAGGDVPGMSDRLAVARGRANAFLAGPPPPRSAAERQLGFH